MGIFKWSRVSTFYQRIQHYSQHMQFFEYRKFAKASTDTRMEEVIYVTAMKQKSQSILA